MKNIGLLDKSNIAAIDYKSKKMIEIQPKTVIDLFEKQVLQYPHKIAVSTEDEKLTFSELSAKTQLVSKKLKANGISPNSCIGIYVEPSIDMMIGTLGILRAGCAYLPLAPEYPEERIRYMIEDSGLKIIFTQSELLPSLQELNLKDITFITTDNLQLASPLEEAALSVCTHSLAYVIYTSGTTGKPKGVEIEHKNLVNQLLWLKSTYEINQDQVVLRKTPMSFDAAQWEILSVVLGATVIMGEPGIYRDPLSMIEAIKRHNVTVLQCVPTLLQALINEAEFVSCSSLKYVFSGGEALTRKLAKTFLNIIPNCKLVNLYGPTECTINASALTVCKEYLKNSPKVVSIGFPVSNTSYYIMDHETGELITDTDKIGELYIGGTQVARGYLNRPEQTEERFISLNLKDSITPVRLYKTGDLASWNANGSVQFVGRVDNQVKLRGYRIELDEIRVAVENHDWVKNAAIFVNKDSDSGFESLIACVELNPREAILMDQGTHGGHHLSKSSRTQVKAQLSQLGLRNVKSDLEKPTIQLLGKEPTKEQYKKAFARKTYRFFEGETINRKKIINLIESEHQRKKVKAINVQQITFAILGEILRNLGPFYSEHRLLPKYAYASPGALYAHQLYLEIEGVEGLDAGLYYFNQINHELRKIKELPEQGTTKLLMHFVGKETAIEAVYKNNVIEVLEMEAGHVLGLLDVVLPEYGLGVGLGFTKNQIMTDLECGKGHRYLGSYPIVSFVDRNIKTDLDLFIQVNNVSDLEQGIYHYKEGSLSKLTKEIIQKKHVIAINQRTYEQASFGIAIVKLNESRWDDYIQLGRQLQILQMNNEKIGLMASGYSSKTGNDLATAKRLEFLFSEIGLIHKSSYFALAGGISSEQILSEGMKEDSIHLKGPSEILKQDLENILPNYMVPNQIVMLDKIPLSANGKVNVELLKATIKSVQLKKEIILPRNTLEIEIAEIWKEVMGLNEVSVLDDFFEVGGDSLLAISLIHSINQNLNTRLPLQTIFSYSTVEALAIQVKALTQNEYSRLVNLNNGKYLKRPIFCWPGLGGYPMNLRTLAQATGNERPFYGVQAFGINEHEQPYSTIAEMAQKDVAMIKKQQPKGPYTLWGYSFGARVAFEVAYQLEKMGEIVDELILIAPGSPNTRDIAYRSNGEYLYSDNAFLSILYSVFLGYLPSLEVINKFKLVNSKVDFINLIMMEMPTLETSLIERITKIVELTYEFKYTFNEMLEHRIKAPISIFKAPGDDYSFIEEVMENLIDKPLLLHLNSDHYQILKTGVNELIELIEKIKTSKLNECKTA